eukprot:m.78749 g.78749  ORF g.78749 m.78749 type:complete len:99 (+) comp11967_c2_seq2:824-1120(+)
MTQMVCVCMCVCLYLSFVFVCFRCFYCNRNSFSSVVEGAFYEDIADPVQALMDKDQTIMDYQETVEILKVKVRKLEQLVKLKDKRVEELSRKLSMYES